MISSEETCAYTAEEIADAQRELDLHPSNSTFWDSRSGQDHLRVILDLKLEPKTTEAERRAAYRAAMSAPIDDEESFEDHRASYGSDWDGA
jgi:hypothetical protein